MIDMRVPDDWFVGFHQGLAARFWHAAGETMAGTDAAIVQALLPRGAVLDVPCGDGRLSARLAAAGYEVTGIDISAEALELARRRDSGVRLVRGDLRALPELGAFDGVLSWGNSFGYLTPPETAGSLAQMRRAVRAGGRLVLESGSVAEALLPGGVEPRREYAFGGITMTATNRYRASESRLESEYEFAAEDGTVERSRAAHHVHTAGEIVRLLRGAGFDRVELLDGDGQGPFELGGGRLIAVAS